LRRLIGLPYWSLSQWVKLKVKNAVNFIGEYEQTLTAEAVRHRVDGVICGHIHHAVIRQAGRLTYVNCGDWVESCTAVVEHFDGRLEIIDWANRPAHVKTDGRTEGSGLAVIPMSSNHHTN
jgi:UDP-2,3-diacylglucosamine pyrophosphatase LpxH